MSLWDILVPAEPGVVHNTIANPSFEYNNVNVYSQQNSTTNGVTNGIKYWNAVSSATISRSNAWASQGTYSLKIAAGATTNSGVEYNPRASVNTTAYTISLSNDTTYTASIPASKSVTVAVMALDDIGMSLANGISDVQNYHFSTSSSEKNSYAYPTIDAKRGHTAPIYSTPITTVLNQSIKIVITDSPTSTVDTAPRGWAIWYTYTDTSPVPDEKMYILASIVPNNNIAETTTVYLRSIILPQKMTLYTNAGSPSYITSDFVYPKRIYGVNTAFTSNDIGKGIYILSENNQYQFVGKIKNRYSTTFVELDTDSQQKNIAYSQFYTISETNPQSFDNNSYGGVSSFIYNTATSTYTNSAIGLNSTAPYFGITNSSFGDFTKKHHLYLDWYLSSPNTTNPNDAYNDTGANWAVYLVNNTTSVSILLGTLDVSTATSTSAKRMGLRKKFLVNRPSGDTSNMSIKIIYTGTTSDADIYIDGVQFVDVGMIWRSYDWYNTTASTYNTPLHFDDWDWNAVDFSYVDGDVPGAIWSDTMPTQSGTYTASFPYFTENGVWHGNPSEYNVSENANGYTSPQFRQQFQWKNEAKPVYGISVPGLSQSSLLIQSTTTGFWAPLTTNNINVVVEPNSTGVGMPEIATTALEYGISDGGFIQRQVARMRNIQFTITISAQSWTGLHANRRSLINLLKFDQLAQQGDRLIRYTGADTIITTSVTYQGGLEYGGTSQNASFTELLQIRFLSADPYFYSLTSLSQNLQINSYNTNDSSHILYKLGNSSEWFPLNRHYFFDNNNGNYLSGETLFYDSNNNITLPYTMGWIASPSGNVSALVVGGNFVRPFKNIAFFYVSGFTENNSDTYTTNSVYSTANYITASTSSPILTASSVSVFYQKPIEGFLIFGNNGATILGIVASFAKTSLGLNSFGVNTANNLVTIVTAGSNPFNSSHVGKGLWTASGVFVGIIATVTANTSPVGATAATLLSNSEVATGNYQMTVGGGTMSNGSNSRVILTTNAFNSWTTLSGVITIIQPSKTTINLSPSNVYGKQLFQLSDNSSISTIYQNSPNSIIAVGDFTSIIESGITNPSTSSDTTYGVVETTQLGYTGHVYSRAIQFTMTDTGRITAQPIDYPSENLTLGNGTIDIVSGSTAVNGVNTDFSSQDSGLSLYYYNIYNNNAKTFIGVIATVISSISVTLKSAYSGSTLSSQQFYISGKSNLYNLLHYTSNYDFTVKNTEIRSVIASAYNAYFFAIRSTTQQSGNQYDNFYPYQLTRSSSSFAKENLNSSVVYLDSVGSVGFVGIRLCSRSVGTISYNSSTSTNLLITGNNTVFRFEWNGKSLFTANGLYIGQIYAVLSSTTLLLCEPPPFVFTEIEFEVSLDGLSIIVDNKTQKNTIYVALQDSSAPSTWNTFVWAFVNNPTPISQISTIIGSRSISAFPQFLSQLGIDNSGTIINSKIDSPNILGADTRFISAMTNNYLVTTSNVIIGQIKTVIDWYNIVLYDNSTIANDTGTAKITVTAGGTAVTGIGTSFVASDVGRKLYNSNKAFIGTIASYSSATSVTLASGALLPMNAETFYLGTTFFIRPYKYITDSVGYQSLGGVILNGNDSVINTNFVTTKQIGTIFNNIITPQLGATANGQPIGQTFLKDSIGMIKGEIVNPFVFTDTTQKNVFIQSGSSLIGQILRRSVGRYYTYPNSSLKSYTPYEPATNGLGYISNGAINANLVFGTGTLNAMSAYDTFTPITGTGTLFQTTDIGRSLYTINYEFIGIIIAWTSTTSITLSNVQLTIAAGTRYYLSGVSVLSSGVNTLTSVSTSSTAITASGGFLSTDVGRMLYTFEGQYIGTIASYSSATAVTLVSNALIAPPTPSTFGISTPLYMYQFNLFANTSSNAFFAKANFGIQTTASYASGTTTAIAVNYCPYGTMSGSYVAYAYVNAMWFYLGDITAFASQLITIGGGTAFAIESDNPIAIIPYVTIDTSANINVLGESNYKVGQELYGNDLYGNTGLSYILGTGTITTSTSSTTVTGVNTAFNSNDTGRLLYDVSGTFIGTISFVGSETNITLTANALVAVTSGVFNISNHSFEGYIGTIAKIKSTYALGTGTISVALAGTAVTGVGTSFAATDIGRVLYNSSGATIGTIGAFTSATSVTLVAGALVAVSPAAAFNISNNQIVLTYMPYYAYNSAFVPTSWKSPNKSITPIVSATNLNSIVYVLAKEFEGSQSSNFFADSIGYVNSISGTVGNQYTIATLNNIPSAIIPNINQSSFSGTQRFTTSTSSNTVTIGTIAGATNITTVLNNGSATLVADSNAHLLVGRSIYTSTGTYLGTVKYATSTTNIIFETGATAAYGAAAYLVTAKSIKFGIYPGDVLRHTDGRLIGQVKSVDIVNLKIFLTGNALVAITSAPVLIQRGYSLGQGIGKILSTTYSSANNTTTITGLSVGSTNITNFTTLPLPYLTTAFASTTITVNSGTNIVNATASVFSSADIGKSIYVVNSSVVGTLVGVISGYVSATQVTLFANYTGLTLTTVSFALANPIGDYGYTKIRIFAEYNGNTYYLGFATASTIPSSSSMTISVVDNNSNAGYSANLPANNSGYNWYYLMEFDQLDSQSRYYSMYQDSNISIQGGSYVTPTIPWASGIGTISKVSYDGTSNVGFGQDSVSIVTGNISASGTNITTRFLDQVYAGNIINIYSGPGLVSLGTNNYTYNVSSANILIYTAGTNPFLSQHVGQSVWDVNNNNIGTIASITANTTAGSIAATLSLNSNYSGGTFSQVSANAFTYSDTSPNLVVRVAGNPFTASMVGFPVYTTAGTLIGTIATVTANTAINTIAATLTTNSAIDGTTFLQVSANTFTYSTTTLPTQIRIVTAGNPFTAAHVGQKLYNNAGNLIGTIATVTANTGIGTAAATLVANSLLSGTTIVGFKGTTVALTTGILSIGPGLDNTNIRIASGIVAKVISNSSMAIKFDYWNDKFYPLNFLSGTYHWNYVAAPTETVIKTQGNTAYINNDWQSLGQQNGYVYTLASLKNGDIFAGGTFTAWSDKSKSSSSGTPSSYRSVYRIAKLVINSTPNAIAESYASPIVGTSYVNNGFGSDVQSIVDVSDINPINGYVGSGDRIMVGGSFTQTMNGENLLPALGFVEGNTMSNSMRPVVNADVEPLTLNGVPPTAYLIAATNRMRHYNNPIASNVLDGINGSNIAVLFNEPVVANTKMQFTSIRIRGNASVYPVITIANTTSNVLDLISLVQTETGARILFNNSKLNIYPNEIITIDLRIGKRSVTSNTRFNLISYIHPLSNFVDWILIGANSAAGSVTQSTDDYHINVIGIHADYGLNASISYIPRFWSFDANNLFYGTTKAGL